MLVEGTDDSFSLGFVVRLLRERSAQHVKLTK